MGNAHGLIITLKRLEIGKPGRKPRLYFACERSGKYRGPFKKTSEKNRISQVTKKCGCPFSLNGIKLPTDDDW